MANLTETQQKVLLQKLRKLLEMTAALDGLEFFNDLGGTLDIEITTDLAAPPAPILSMMTFAPEAAKIKSLGWSPYIYGNYGLLSEHLEIIVFQKPTIVVAGEAKVPVEHHAPNGQFFTVKDMIQVVIETERQTREETAWFGGMDLHHIFFEGISTDLWGDKEQDQVWYISWGS